MDVYHLYGICLKSEWPLPSEPLKRPRTVDVEILRCFRSLVPEQELRAVTKLNRENWYHRAQLPNGSDYVAYWGLLEFLVSPDGHRIIAHPLTNGCGASFNTHLLGQALSFALIKQGIEPIHCTAAVVDGEAIGFLGDSGFGKSSLAASFLKQGYRLLTDDLLVLKEEESRVVAYPGLPRIKLYPEIADRLLGEGVRGTAMNKLTTKLIIPLSQLESHSTAVPLNVMYVLNQPSERSHSDSVTIKTLSQRSAFVALLENTYNAAVTDPDRLSRQFTFAVQIASRIPVKLLTYPRKLEMLPLVRDAILSDIAI